MIFKCRSKFGSTFLKGGKGGKVVNSFGSTFLKGGKGGKVVNSFGSTFLKGGFTMIQKIHLLTQH